MILVLINLIFEKSSILTMSEKIKIKFYNFFIHLIFYFLEWLKSILELKICLLKFVGRFWDNKECFRVKNKFIEVSKMFLKCFLDKKNNNKNI